MHQALKIGRALQVIQHGLVLPAIASDQDQTRGPVPHALFQAAPDAEQEGQVLAGFDGAYVNKIRAGGNVRLALLENRLQAQVGHLNRRHWQLLSLGKGQQLLGRIIGVYQDF